MFKSCFGRRELGRRTLRSVSSKGSSLQEACIQPAKEERSEASPLKFSSSVELGGSADPSWESLLISALPYSMAITSMDAKVVLYHKCGVEPSAAQLLNQALLSQGACSFLTALLGPELEAVALKDVQDHGFWKGSAILELSAEETIPCLPDAYLAEPVEMAGLDSRPNGPSGTAFGLRGRSGHSITRILKQRQPRMQDKSMEDARWIPQSEDWSKKPQQTRIAVPTYLGSKSCPISVQFGKTSVELKTAKQEEASRGGIPLAGVSNLNLPSVQRSKSSIARRNVKRASSLLMTPEQLERFMNENDASISRTAALLRSLSQKKQDSPHTPKQEKMRDKGCSTDAIHGQRASSTPYLENHYSSQHAVFASQGSLANGVPTTTSHGLSGLPTSDLDRAVPNLSTSTLSASTHYDGRQSFDFTLTKLSSSNERNKVLIIISNSTDHMRMRATLSTLAESQLELLSSIMPQHAIQFLATERTEAVAQHVGQLARAHTGVTLMFMDICGFTAMSKSVEPAEVLIFLNTLFSLFDQLTDIHGVHKVETAGDCYIVSGGITSPAQDTNGFGIIVEDNQDPAKSAHRVMAFAKALLEVAKQVTMPDTHQPVRVRVGMHTGDVVSGLIGCKLPKWGIFGDTMNTASRMESTGVPGRIHVSETTHALLPHETWEATGGIEVKGKGQMQTYLWVPKPTRVSNQPQRPLLPSSREPTETLPCVMLRYTHTLLKQLNVPAPTFYPTPDGVLQEQAGACRLMQLR